MEEEVDQEQESAAAGSSGSAAYTCVHLHAPITPRVYMWVEFILAFLYRLRLR